MATRSESYPKQLTPSADVALPNRKEQSCVVFPGQIQLVRLCPLTLFKLFFLWHWLPIISTQNCLRLFVLMCLFVLVCRHCPDGEANSARYSVYIA